MLGWFGDAVRFPLRGERRGDAVAAGWLCVLAHGLLPVVPLVPLAGYLLRAMRTSGEGADAPPSVFADPVALLRTGVGGAALAVAYAGPAVAVVILTLGGASAGGPLDPSSLLVLVATSVGAVTLLVAAYLLPVALARYAATGSLRAAFATRRLRRVARSGRYLLGWLAAAVVLDAGGLLAVALAGQSGAGAVLAALVAAYALLVGARLLGVSVAAAGGFGDGGASA